MAMKKLVIILMLFSGAVGAHAQGTIQFGNSTLSPILYSEQPGSPIVPAPPGTHVGVFWGPDAAGRQVVVGMGRGTMATPTATVGSTPGVWYASAAYPISGTAEGQRIWLKIGAWVGGTDTSFWDAVYGESDVVSVLLGPAIGPGVPVWQRSAGTATDRAKPFVIAPIPEPSIFALGSVLLGAMILGRRRKPR